MSTISQLFAATVSADPARPLLTWYDDATGERTELSGATLANWVSKTANLLVDGLGLGPGSVASIALPPHWQTAAIMLASWTAGLAVSHSDELPADVAFVAADTAPTAPDTYAVGLHPFALPLRGLPAGVSDWVSSARAHGDFYGGPPADPNAAALVGLPGGGGSITHAELAERAVARAKELGIERGERVLLDLGAHPRPLDWLVAPLAAGASLVLSHHTAPGILDSRAATERAEIIS
ncbi:TIGR03089 family protein [Catellatospora tritici]|uniref:TIGR03089 family protein n=1 Tax=Catellatospora tritici TaxID=2851566 RepID=UPI001C2DB373|nr:TIGR03089 family protein [Catellatospora tritici]MBV1849521.1 TIGR03089 family protein [Catellatospora tritici]MBV1854093.1 TIGR03089 family protein [Catellatospora tritici]